MSAAKGHLVTQNVVIRIREVGTFFAIISQADLSQLLDKFAMFNRHVSAHIIQAVSQFG
jgi:hypothetical protein